MDHDALDLNLQQPLEKMLALEQYRLRELHGVEPRETEAELAALGLMPSDIVIRVAAELQSMLKHEQHEEEELKKVAEEKGRPFVAPPPRPDSARKSDIEAHLFLKFNAALREQHDALARVGVHAARVGVHGTAAKRDD